MSKLIGCGSHSCAVFKPESTSKLEGLGNNGPCKCMVADYRGQSLVRAYEQRIEELTHMVKDINEYEDDIERLETALQKIVDGKNNLGWQPCAYIAEQALEKS